jgi:hypothetical protein
MPRLSTHSHLPKYAYAETTEIKFIHIKDPLLMDILEIIAINIYKPKYNTQNLYNLNSVPKILYELFSQNVPDVKDWTSIPKEIFTFQRTPLSDSEKREKMMAGITRAKIQGKYKGRKAMQIDQEKFISLLQEWQRGERTAVSIQKEFNITATTFYRWLKKDCYKNYSKKEKGGTLKNEE